MKFHTYMKIWVMSKYGRYFGGSTLERRTHEVKDLDLADDLEEFSLTNYCETAHHQLTEVEGFRVAGPGWNSQSF